jgi:hypothetical protein
MGRQLEQIPGERAKGMGENGERAAKSLSKLLDRPHTWQPKQLATHNPAQAALSWKARLQRFFLHPRRLCLQIRDSKRLSFVRSIVGRWVHMYMETREDWATSSLTPYRIARQPCEYQSAHAGSFTSERMPGISSSAVCAMGAVDLLVYTSGNGLGRGACFDSRHPGPDRPGEAGRSPIVS